MSPEEIKSALESSIDNCSAQVSVEGSHVKLVVVSPVFEGLSPVKKQQLVYGVLQNAISSGVIHAVHMQTFTPDQWAAQQS